MDGPAQAGAEDDVRLQDSALAEKEMSMSDTLSCEQVADEQAEREGVRRREREAPEGIFEDTFQPSQSA